MKKLIGLMMVCLLTAGMMFGAGAQETDAEAPMTLRYGEVNPDGHPITEGAYKFADLVNESTDGRITIDIYPAGQLGSEREQMQSMQQGGLDFFRGNTASMPDFGVPEMAVLGLPYVFSSREHMWRALEGEAGQLMLDKVQEHGTRMVGLSFLDDGARHIFTTDVPAREIDDLQGLRIRVPENEVFVDMVAHLGASPTPISYGELYSALQTGVVDGAENTIAGYLTNSFYEPAPYLTLNRHMSPPGVILVSEITWNRLSEADQQIILDAAEKSSAHVTEATRNFEEDGIEELKERGATIIELDNVEPWQEAVQPMWDIYGGDYQELLALIQDAE